LQHLKIKPILWARRHFNHNSANLRYYEQAVKRSTKQAHFHRKIAAELLQREYAKPAEIPDQQGNHTIETKNESNTNNL
jgi:hypothetical protein